MATTNGNRPIKGGMCKDDEDVCNSRGFCVWNHPGRLHCPRGEDCCSPNCENNHMTILCIYFKNCTKRESCTFRHPKNPTWNSREDLKAEISGSSELTVDGRRRHRSTSGERRTGSSGDDFGRTGFVKNESRGRDEKRSSQLLGFGDKRGVQQRRSKSQAGYREMETEERETLDSEEVLRKKREFRDFSKATFNLKEVLGTERLRLPEAKEVSRSPERGGREDSRSSAWGDWGSLGDQRTFNGEASRRTGEEGRGPTHRGRGRGRGGSHWTNYRNPEETPSRNFGRGRGMRGFHQNSSRGDPSLRRSQHW